MTTLPAAPSKQDRLYQLLPAFFRIRDAERGEPLRALLQAMTAQADELAAAIARQYDNWFVETCDDDLLPYFAALVGLELGAPVGAASDESVQTDAIWRRRQVANAVADRRRKGSFSVLEQLAADATGWPAKAIEVGSTVVATQSITLPNIGRRPLIDLGEGDALDTLGTPLSDAAPLLDVRRMSSHRTPGDANPDAVSVWLWRLVAQQVRRAPAAQIGDEGQYAFDQLGRTGQLATRPATSGETAPPATNLDVPIGITRRALSRRLEDYYGPARSICVYRGREPVPRSEILVADLGRRRLRTPPQHVTIDPELGLLAFPARDAPDEGVYVTYSHLGLGVIGGGDYARQPPVEPTTYRVGAPPARAHRTVGGALRAWAEAKKKEPAAAAMIEIVDDRVYEERFEIELTAGERLTISAAEGCRPILIPAEATGRQPGRFHVRGLAGDRDEPHPSVGEPDATTRATPTPLAELVLDGVWLARRPLELSGRFKQVTLRHCTLVPAGGVADAGSGRDYRSPSLIVRTLPCPISIVSSVVGRVLVESPEAGFDPVGLTVTDSVIDSGDEEEEALLGGDDRPAWVSLTLRRVTVLGGAHVHGVALVEDSILTGPLDCERRQHGSVKFSYISPGSRSPKRVACQPDDALSSADAAALDAGFDGRERARIRARELLRLKPRFDAVDFDAPEYARLSADAPEQLTRGAHDEGELGAYHDLWEALRTANLATRLREFAPVGIDIDTRFAT